MKRTHLVLLALVAGGCSTPSGDPAEPAAVSEEALPLIRYYVIADT
jgi:hypothetical protein